MNRILWVLFHPRRTVEYIDLITGSKIYVGTMKDWYRGFRA